jgi:hypothetical protein
MHGKGWFERSVSPIAEGRRVVETDPRCSTDEGESMEGPLAAVIAASLFVSGSWLPSLSCASPRYGAIWTTEPPPGPKNVPMAA